MKYNVLIIGATGMLGSIVSKYLGNQLDITLHKMPYYFPSHEFKTYLKSNSFDYIINCAGSIPQRNKNFDLNYDLTNYLINNPIQSKILFASSDCTRSGKLKCGLSYHTQDSLDADDEYGKSKAHADLLVIDKKNSRFKIMRTSIIGLDKEKVSLLSWFLGQTKNATIKGRHQAYWNGITVLSWAKIAYQFIKNWNDYAIVTQISSKNIYTKYDLLNIFKEIFMRQDINILYDSEPHYCNRSLHGDITISDITEQLVELKEFNPL